jgi:PilZ domain
MDLRQVERTSSISVILSCTDVHGRKCEQSVTAHDLSQQGARLDGITQTLAPGTRVTLQYKETVVLAQIVWVVVVSSGAKCQAGIRLLDPKRCPWKDPDSQSHHARYFPERRKSERYKMSVGVELSDEGQRIAMRGSTVDVGIGGCYIETLFPPAIGVRLQVLLWLGPAKLLAKGIVRASYPGVGMGIEFLDLSWEETECLYKFLEDNRNDTQ